jgi:NADPH-dependent curcumin reductase CurA
VPLIVEVREMVQRRINALDRQADARLFTGPRGGRITTAVLRAATDGGLERIPTLFPEPFIGRGAGKMIAKAS